MWLIAHPEVRREPGQAFVTPRAVERPKCTLNGKETMAIAKTASKIVSFARMVKARKFASFATHLLSF